MEKNWLVDIAQIVRIMEDQETKNYVVKHWNEIKKISTQVGRAEELINAICAEDLKKIKKII